MLNLQDNIKKYNKYKHSGIEWIIEIPESWGVSKYKYFARSGMGETILSEQLVDDGIPVYSATQEDKIFGYIEKPSVLLKKGDLVIPARGNSIGCVTFISDETATCTQTTIYSKLSNINKKFLFYVSQGLKDKWFEFDDTAIPQITVRQVQNNLLPLPESAEEQQQIVNFLDEKCGKIDATIETEKQIIEKLKEYKQSVITEAVTKGLDKNISMKVSGIEWIGEIPQHWKIMQSRRLFSERKDKIQDGDAQLTASQKYGIIDQEEFMRIENQKVTVVYKGSEILKHVEPNDFVISMRSFQGGLEYSKLRGCISSAYVMLIPNEKVEPKYFRWLFKSVTYIQALQSTSNLVRDGQAMRFSNFAQVPLVIFAKEEQLKISIYLDEKCAKIDEAISHKEQVIEKLTEYKKSLIYECVTGKRKVC